MLHFSGSRRGIRRSSCSRCFVANRSRWWVQVLHCGEELINAKKYYRRYRICQLHCNM
jgi:hypothetical protein